MDRVVAIKILKPEYVESPGFVEKFKTEAQAAARLSHPNIVNIFDVGQEIDTYYIVMEYVEGRTLKEVIAEQAPLSLEMAVNISIMICDGIHHAHERGIIHRDIKPHNILLTNTGIVKVADFGIAQAISTKTITFGKSMVGSVHYISPEQARGEPVTRASDIYSLGCVLYEMLTGIVPFDAESPITVALKHIHDDPAPPRSINNRIPPNLENIVLHAMDKVPSRRYASAEQMRNSLLAIELEKGNYNGRHERGKTIIMPSISNEGDEYAPTKKKHGNVMVVSLIILLGLFSGIFYIMGDSFFGEEVVVPNIQGLNIVEANQQLKDVNLSMNVHGYDYSDEYEKDTIISQTPQAGQKVKEDRVINVILSKGSQQVKVPSIVGLSKDTAEIRIQNSGLIVGSIDQIYDDKYEKDHVISQSPLAGQMADKGDSVDLMVSKGPTPQKVAMPDLLGLNLEAARRKLEENKLVLGDATRQESNEYYNNQVMAQDVAAGVMVEEQTTINLVISKGPGPVAQTKTLEFQLPEDNDYYKVVIIIRDAKGSRSIYNELHEAGDSITVVASYYGKGTAEVQLNGRTYKTFTL
ncbi:protein kinase domain-containing protein [Syntrophomonas palmitatica]|uniref:protein kinase domain-containing protein n=1 Tax=Syntrophomonas palmitatica TaxID=402877 RepID=UPI0006D07CCD|nr:PASTA domain-containing protein [Syntrophomonas palmitatica]